MRRILVPIGLAGWLVGAATGQEAPRAEAVAGKAFSLFPQLLGNLQELPEGPPEFGLGLTPDESEEGWVSLFDGSTPFGWTDAQVENGRLSRGSTTAAFGRCTIRAVVERKGTITAGGVAYPVEPGPWTIAETKQPGPILLGPGVQVSTLVVRPLGLQTIFDGRSRQGWTIVERPGAAANAPRATWDLVDGTLRARGGPGALEYPGRFGDAVLQVTARTRARHANAGFFVRCVPGSFMNGYEAQIYNRCEADDPAKPARYATGAIDDRQNARRLVSRDGRWFVLTVVAAGPHLATWVNGRQVTDWTDTRPPDDNPRRGLRLEAGTIQLQAHDPATDVEFRSVRAGRLPLEAVAAP